MYYLHYVKHSMPRIKKFETKKALAGFIDKFPKSDKAKKQGNWLEFAFQSESVVCYDDYYAEQVME